MSDASSATPTGTLPVIVVRRAEECDLDAMATINAAVFNGHHADSASAREWMAALMRAWPVYQYYVIVVDGVIAGYIGWQMHGGFLRPEPAVELEQLGIDKAYQGQKLGPRLSRETLSLVIAEVVARNNRIESSITFFVWAYANNLSAMSVYLEMFTDGVVGSRIVYGDRGEVVCRFKVPRVIHQREGNGE